jgi:pyruvate/2-oxoglutarate dehydrogenase complex dihydrolipoamide dehydrogenase (E3) component
LKDSARIKKKTEGKSVVIMGTGFIAMELISSLHSHCKDITVLGRSKRPYGAVLGETVGRIIEQKVTEKWKNITIYGCEEIKRIKGDDHGKVRKVVTTKKREISCDVVIYAIGAVPNTEFLLPPIEEGDLTTAIPKLPLNALSSGHIPTNEVGL